MFKSLLALVLFAASSFSFAADPIFLPWAAKAQSGFYSVTDLSQLPPTRLPATGLALEVFDSTETFLGYTPLPNTQYVFGAYFAASLTVVFQEDTSNVSTTPNVHNLLLSITDNNGTYLVGHGTLTFDPLSNGDAHTINAVFDFDVPQFWNFLYQDHTKWVYRLNRLSNVKINNCELQVGFSPPDVTLPCN